MHQEQRKLEIRGIELGFTMSDKFVGFGRTAAEEDNWYYNQANNFRGQFLQRDQ